MEHGRDTGPQPRSTGLPATAAPRRVGSRVRHRDGVLAGADGPIATKAGGRPFPSSPLPHRAWHGVPLRSLTFLWSPIGLNRYLYAITTAGDRNLTTALRPSPLQLR